MRRRHFICQLGGLLVTTVMPVAAQTPSRTYRLGHLGNSSLAEIRTRETVLPELAKLGFAEGRNLVFDVRVGDADAMPGLMRELLATQPDAVMAVGLTAIRAAGAATRTVPIVTFGADPIELGLAQSYARPGANVTGVVILGGELEIKRLSILQEAVPDRRRIAILNPATGSMTSDAAMRATAASRGIELLVFTVATPADYPAAFAAMQAAGAQALVIAATPEFYRDTKQLAALALETKLPTVCEWAEMAHDGCLIGYGPSRTALRKRNADQIAQIFRGDPPGNIAIERPVEFNFAVNQKIAKALNVSIPVAILARADEVIE